MTPVEMINTIVDYERIFERERQQVYPAIDSFEWACGFALERSKLEAAARVLCCPLKASPPNWQHGRVIYSVVRNYLKNGPWITGEPIQCLDIGTAKGFSALCLLWAGEGFDVSVTSVDVLPPGARVRRNTVAEVEGLRTLDEILEPWPDATQITFVESTGIQWLKSQTHRVNVAFVDGKHTDDAVYQEGRLLAARQTKDDVVIFDDWQVPGVAVAIRRLEKYYQLQVVTAKVGRAYVIGRRR